MCWPHVRNCAVRTWMNASNKSWKSVKNRLKFISFLPYQANLAYYSRKYYNLCCIDKLLLKVFRERCRVGESLRANRQQQKNVIWINIRCVWGVSLRMRIASISGENIFASNNVVEIVVRFIRITNFCEFPSFIAIEGKSSKTYSTSSSKSISSTQKCLRTRDTWVLKIDRYVYLAKTRSDLHSMMR